MSDTKDVTGVTTADDPLAPWRALEVLAATDRHVAGWVARLFGGADPDVVLAFALAVRAPRHGHLAVDLGPETTREALVAAGRDDLDAIPEDAPRLPEDRRDWIARVAAHPAVTSCGVANASSEPCRTPFALRGRWLYTARYWNYELRTAARLRGWAEAEPTPLRCGKVIDRGLDLLFRPPGADLGAPPTTGGRINRQRLAASMACRRRFTVVTGGPGMGKTWTVRNILALLLVEHHVGGEASRLPPLRIGLAAPTGKAAARMCEALRNRLEDELVPTLHAWLGDRPDLVEVVRASLLDLDASTLHRMLGPRPDNPSRFRHHARNPLPYDVVVVDETSMVDFALMTKLVDAVGPDTRLILLGDRNQLASVEAGTVLADICGPVRPDALRLTAAGRVQLSAPPVLDLEAAPDVEEAPAHRPMYDAVVQFDRTYRFDDDSGIGRFAAACLERPFDASRAAEVLTNGGADDVSMRPPTRDGQLGAAIEAAIVEGYAPYLRALASAAPADEAEERRLHAAVLAAFDRFRILCAHGRGRLGVSGINERVEALLRRAGYLRERGRFFEGRPILIRRNDYTVHRYNGDIGLVVRMRRGDHAGRRVVVFPGIDGVEYLAPSRLPEHETVFGMTIHKSQGSEYEHVMVVLPQQTSRICTRELVYTGVTRARLRMTMVAEHGVLVDALERRVRRASGLSQALWGDDPS